MRLAAICPVYNEEDLLPHFLDFYCRQVDTVLLLDNESTDRTAELARGRANVVVSTFNTENTFNDRMQHEELVKRRGECVGVYDYVLIVDCDEFVLPKGGGTLKECIERQSPADAYGTHGFRMIQGPGEGQYNPSVGLLEQRRWGWKAPGWSQSRSSSAREAGRSSSPAAITPMASKGGRTS